MTGWLHVVVDVTRPEPTAAFWAAALGWSLGAPWTDRPELRSFAPSDGDAYAHLQQVGVDPGVHLHLEVADLDAETERLVALGARVGRRTGVRRTLRSPGGLALCLVPERRRSRPGPVTGPTGARRRLVQVCIDLPAARADVEAAFWRAVLPWPETTFDAPEFLGRLVPPSGPLQVLLQRLGTDDSGNHTRAHLDLGSDDLAADVALMEALGAARLLAGDGFVALRDPAGGTFCVTGNAPDAPEVRTRGWRHPAG